MPAVGTEVGVCVCVFCRGGMCVCVYMDTDIDTDIHAFPFSVSP